MIIIPSSLFRNDHSSIYQGVRKIKVNLSPKCATYKEVDFLLDAVQPSGHGMILKIQNTLNPRLTFLCSCFYSVKNLSYLITSSSSGVKYKGNRNLPH